MIEHKYTVVTGAASDIGMEICRELAGNGRPLLMVDIDGTALEEFAATLPEPSVHRCLTLDLSDAEEFGTLLEKYLQAGHLAVGYAVFAAGIFSVAPLRMLSHDKFCRMLDVSVYSAVRILQILTSRKVNDSCLESVVFISSISARVGSKGYALYGAAKASILGLAHSLAVELAPRVRVNSILPGGMRTRATAFVYDASEEMDARQLLGEGRPSDVAGVVSFLLADESRWITGQELVVDGGYLAH